MMRRLWDMARGGTSKKTPAPNVSARVTTPEGASWDLAFRSFLSDLHWLDAKFPVATYEIIDALMLWDPNFARYHQTTLSLGNPGHALELNADTDSAADAAYDAANDLAARCFPFAGGMDGLVNGLVSQVARTGGLCVEWVPDEGLTRVERAYLVPIRTLRFRPTETGEYELGQIQDGSFVAVNQVQTSFYSTFQRDGNPYPVPPTLGALTTAVTHRRMKGSLSDWFDKLSAMGFLQLKYQRPEIRPGESEDAYRSRCRALLTDLMNNAKDNLSGGIVAGFDDLEAVFNNTSAGGGGAASTARLIEEDLFAGMGRDPVMFGRSFSRTETWASVAYEELVSQIENVRIGVKRALEHGHRLNLALLGMGDVGVSVRFKELRSLDAFRDAEAEMMRGNGVRSDYSSGLISTDEARRLLGYEDRSAASGRFTASFERSVNRYILAPAPRRVWAVDIGARDQRDPRGQRRTESGPPQRADHGEVTLAASRKAGREYLLKVRGMLTAAGRAGVDALLEWARGRDIPDEEMFISDALDRFIAGAEDAVDGEGLERLAKLHLATLWAWSRHEDASIFGRDWDRGTRGVGVVIGESDVTAINYMARVDRFYVSKFISGDEQRTGREIASFLRTEYLEQGLGRGASTRELSEFADRFGELVDRIGEHRARVIIDTGVSRAQNWGSILSLRDANVTRFMIDGPWDRLTCAWCKAMRGKEFEVRREAERIENVISSGDEDISKFDRFITSRWGTKQGVHDLAEASAEDIQAGGGCAPPIHPQCRHRVVAVSRRTERA